MFTIQELCVLPTRHIYVYQLISLYNTNSSVFVTERERVYCSVHFMSTTVFSPLSPSSIILSVPHNQLHLHITLLLPVAQTGEAWEPVNNNARSKIRWHYMVTYSHFYHVSGVQLFPRRLQLAYPSTNCHTH
jgi:hypothetical protein